MSEPKLDMAVIHRSGTVHILGSRKGTGDGWWLVYGGGLSDHALAGPDWRVLDESALRLLFPKKRSRSDKLSGKISICS